MRYIAFLRGINVGGNSIVSMAKLKEVFESQGYSNVKTYINSGNVLFESSKTSETLINEIEKHLEATFSFPIRVIVLTHDQLKEVIADAPKSWTTNKDIRCYIAFVKLPTKPKSILSEITFNPDVDSVAAGNHAIYMTTKMAGITKSGFAKLAGKKVYKEITIRNLNTTRKLLDLMEKIN